MTKPDDILDPAGMTLGRALIGLAAGLVLIFAVGAVVGMATALIEHGTTAPLKMAAIFAATIAVIAACIVVLRRQFAGALREPVSAKTRRARIIAAGFVVVGAIVGGVLAHSDTAAGPEIGQFAPSPALAIAAIVVWAVVIPLMTLVWWRQIDEHEALAYKDGAFLALNAYAVLAPSWWLGWRAGFFVEPDQMLIFILTMFVWGAVWVVRRFS